MKVLIIGSDGFLGHNAVDGLSGDHEVIGANRSSSEYPIDLKEPDSIASALASIQPKAIINCAGVVENSNKADLNPVFTENLLRAIVVSKLKLQRVVIIGSAAEYGVVGRENEPTKETAPLMATSPYGMSKIRETETAIEYARNYRLPVIVARLFNPIGTNMPSRLLVPRIIDQVKAIQQGQRASVDVSRLDARRDYINVKDVVSALNHILCNQPKSHLYNIGSGVSTSNQEIIDLILRLTKNLPKHIKICQTADEPEPLYADRADISRMRLEFAWRPKYSIEDAIKEIVEPSLSQVEGGYAN